MNLDKEILERLLKEQQGRLNEEQFRRLFGKKFKLTPKNHGTDALKDEIYNFVGNKTHLKHAKTYNKLKEKTNITKPKAFWVTTKKIVDALYQIIDNTFDKDDLYRISKLRNNRNSLNVVEEEDIYIAATLDGVEDDIQRKAISFVEQVQSEEFGKLFSDSKKADLKQRATNILKSKTQLKDEPPPRDPFYTGDTQIPQLVKYDEAVPSYMQKFFELSGIRQGTDLVERLNKFAGFMNLYSNPNTQVVAGTVESNFNNILVSEYFYKLLFDLLEGTIKSIQRAGRRLEVFLALLIGGTAQTKYNEFDDIIIGDTTTGEIKAKYVSVKLVSKKTMIYQANSTIEKFFERNPSQTVTYISGVKDFSGKDKIKIYLYSSEYTRQEYEAAKQKPNQLVNRMMFVSPGAYFGIQGTVGNREHSHNTTNNNRTYIPVVVNNNQYVDDSGKTKSDEQLYKKETAHIVFADFGNHVGTIELPRKYNNFIEKRKQFMQQMNIQVDSLYEAVSKFKNASTKYFSEPNDMNQEIAVSNLDFLNNIGYEVLLDYKEEGEEELTKETKEKKLNLLDKMIKKVILEEYMED